MAEKKRVLITDCEDVHVKQKNIKDKIKVKDRKRLVFDHYRLKVKVIRMEFTHLYNNVRYKRNLLKLETAEIKL